MPVKNARRPQTYSTNAEPPGNPSGTPTRTLTSSEAVTLIWRGIKHHYQTSSPDELTRNQQRLTWLQTAPLPLFTQMLQPGVSYTDAMLLTAIEGVKTEILDNIDHILRTASKGPPRPVASIPKAAQLERLPAYLIADGATLTRLLDGALSAQHQDQQRLFAGNQTQQAISWLDTLVRAANNHQGARRNRMVFLLLRTLPDLSEALALAADASKLQEAIKLIEEIITVNQEE